MFDEKRSWIAKYMPFQVQDELSVVSCKPFCSKAFNCYFLHAASSLIV